MDKKDQIKQMLRMAIEDVDIPPLDPEEFAFVCAMAFAAGAGVTPMESPTKSAFRIKMPDGKIETCALPDIPEMRATSAIFAHYGEARAIESFYAASRYAALRGLMLADARMREWITNKGEGCYEDGRLLVDDAVIETAAVFPITSTGIKNRSGFFKEVLRRHRAKLKTSPSCAAVKQGDGIKTPITSIKWAESIELLSDIIFDPYYRQNCLYLPSTKFRPVVNAVSAAEWIERMTPVIRNRKFKAFLESCMEAGRAKLWGRVIHDEFFTTAKIHDPAIKRAVTERYNKIKTHLCGNPESNRWPALALCALVRMCSANAIEESKTYVISEMTLKMHNIEEELLKGGYELAKLTVEYDREFFNGQLADETGQRMDRVLMELAYIYPDTLRFFMVNDKTPLVSPNQGPRPARKAPLRIIPTPPDVPVTTEIRKSVRIKKSLRYFCDVAEYYDARHDPAACCLCNPSLIDKTLPEALYWVYESVMKIRIGDKIATAQRCLDDIESYNENSTEDYATAVYGEDLADYLGGISAEVLAHDWRRKKPEALSVFKEYIGSDSDHLRDLIDDSHDRLLPEIKEIKYPKTLAHDEMQHVILDSFWRQLPRMIRDASLESENAIYKMDRLFDSMIFYPLSPKDSLAMEWGLPGLRGLSKEIRHDLRAFWQAEFPKYTKTQLYGTTPDVLFLDAHLAAFIRQALLPYLKNKYPRLYTKISKQQSAVISKLSKMGEGDSIEELIAKGQGNARGHHDVFFSEKAWMYLANQDYDTMLDHSEGKSSDIVDSLFEAATNQQLVRAIKKMDPQIKVSASDFADGYFPDEILHELYDKQVEPLIFKDSVIDTNVSPDDELFRENLKITYLRQFPPLLRPWIYRRAWISYCKAIMGLRQHNEKEFTINE